MRRFVPRFQSRQSRRTLRIPCQIVRDRDFKLVASELLNLSASGVLAPTGEAVLTGEKVWVSFKLPRTDTWIDTTGTVARVAHGRRKGEYARTLGIELDTLRPWLGFLLKGTLDTCPAAPPCARPGRRKLWKKALALLDMSGRAARSPEDLAAAA